MYSVLCLVRTEFEKHLSVLLVEMHCTAQTYKTVGAVAFYGTVIRLKFRLCFGDTTVFARRD